MHKVTENRVKRKIEEGSSDCEIAKSAAFPDTRHARALPIAAKASAVAKASATLNMLVSVLAGLLATTGASLVGSRFPSIDLDLGFPPTKVDISERIKGKDVIILGLPGAFTPT